MEMEGELNFSDEPRFPLLELRQKVAALARDGVYVGTSSWKYEGWLGSIYSPARYCTRGRFSTAKFEANCLGEYAETFKTVCLDGAFYQFPTDKMVSGLFSQLTPDFKLSLKVTEDITAYRFPTLPRFGTRSGVKNEHFLNSELFIERFLGPLSPYQNQVGTLFLEFSRFQLDDLSKAEFLRSLDTFLEKLPKGWNYSVEIRNEELLGPDYFSILSERAVAHAFNSWSQMPPVLNQMAMPGSETTDFQSARFLLKPGRTYEKAVKAFQPYTAVQDPYPEGRTALAELLKARPSAGKPGRRFIYVNNRLEGSALGTILAALKLAGL